VEHLKAVETATQPFSAGRVKEVLRRGQLQESQNTARLAEATPCASLSLAQWLTSAGQ